jgi:hypothetical protein
VYGFKLVFDAQNQRGIKGESKGNQRGIKGESNEEKRQPSLNLSLQNTTIAYLAQSFGPFELNQQ